MPIPIPEVSPRAPSSPGASAPPARAAWALPWVFSTYFAEGLPYSIVHQISGELFTAMGASLSAIGLTALYGLPWNLKLFWSPFVERAGTARRWILATEVALGLSVLAIARPAGAGDLGTVARVLVAVAFLAATQDVAVDGYYLRVLDREQQAGLSGFRVGAYRLALVFGKGGLVALAGLTSWFWCFAGGAAVLLFLASFHALVLRPDAPPAAAGPWWTSFSTFLARPRIGWTLGLVVTFRAGDALMFAMSSPLLKDLGLDTTARGLVSGTVGTAASISGSLLGAYVLKRVDLRRALFPIALVQSVAIGIYVWLAWARPGFAGVAVAVAVEQLVAGVGTSAFMVFLMRKSEGEHAVSHFAIASALMSLATTLAGSASGFVAERVGFVGFFAIALAASLPGVVLSRSAAED